MPVDRACDTGGLSKSGAELLDSSNRRRRHPNGAQSRVGRETGAGLGSRHFQLPRPDSVPAPPFRNVPSAFLIVC